MSGGGASGVMIVQEMLRNMRNQQREREARREFMLQRRRNRKLQRPEEGARREGFSCYLLCGECGYLGDARGQCPSCGEQSWIDLANVGMAYRLRELDEARRVRAPRWVRAVAGALAIAMAGAVALALFLCMGVIPAALGSLPVGLLVFFFAQRPLAVLLVRLQKKRPARWRSPELPRRGRPRELSGRVENEGEPLVAPLSGRACVAYRVAVLFDTPGDARPAEWVLDETRAVDVRVGEERIAGERMLLQNGLEEISADALATSFDLETFLRQRGLHLSDGQHWLFECVLEPGELASAALYSNGTCALRSARFDRALSETRAGQLALPTTARAGLLAVAPHSGEVALVPKGG